MKGLWKRTEDIFLRKNYNSLSIDSIAKELIRPRGSVISRASKLGISINRTWSTQEINFLKNNFHKMYIKDMIKLPLFKKKKRTYKAILDMAHNKLGLKRGRKGANHPMWSGGKGNTFHGYVVLRGIVLCPYTLISKSGESKTLEHHYVWWLNYPDNPILDNEVIHHIDGNKKNNDIRNLVKLTKSEHSKLHNDLRRKNGNNSINSKK